jgi:hypothetical protein
MDCSRLCVTAVRAAALDRPFFGVRAAVFARHARLHIQVRSKKQQHETVKYTDLVQILHMQP